MGRRSWKSLMFRWGESCLKEVRSRLGVVEDIGVEVVTIGQKCSPIDLKNGKKAIIIA